ncbi:MAG: hypothetical protein IJA41_02755 [Clostridia bacterium]|nr:hypothetical protein [Clostridia bacterium]MBQ3549876.1 hypothetical protein [Clostridia bacterium]
MLTYVKYFVTWVFFMALIAAITLLVPRLAKKIDKWRAEKKADRKPRESMLSPISEEEKQQAENGDGTENFENNE